jgi:hypothetical protein
LPRPLRRTGIAWLNAVTRRRPRWRA